MLNDGKIFTVIYSKSATRLYMTVMYKLSMCQSVSLSVSVSLRSRRPLSKSPRPLALIHYLPCFTSV